jgi:hypothetical protein
MSAAVIYFYIGEIKEGIVRKRFMAALSLGRCVRVSNRFCVLVFLHLCACPF